MISTTNTQLESSLPDKAPQTMKTQAAVIEKAEVVQVQGPTVLNG